MSADNWAMCPRCKAQRQKSANDARKKAQAAYGKVDLDKFDALRAQADQLATLVDRPPADQGETFREDYGVYGAEDGEIVISYRGGCSRCGLSFSVEHQHPLDIGPIS